VEDNEWAKGRENVHNVLKNELKACDLAKKQLEDAVGKRKLKDVTSFIERVRKGDVVLGGDVSSGAGGFSADLLERGRQAVFLSDRAAILKMRLLAIKSKQCSNKANKYHCPEIFLDVVADKLTSTAVLFLNVELLSDFYYNFPRELDLRLGKGLSEAEIERFASEDPKVKRQLDVIRKKDMLELVLQKIEGLRALEGRAKREARGEEKGAKGRWSLF